MNARTARIALAALLTTGVLALAAPPPAGAQACPLIWREVGGGLTRTGVGLNPTVWAEVSFDDGNGPLLVAAGDFDGAGGLTVSNIAAWDGAGWSDLGGGVNGHVDCLAVFDDDGPGPIRPALYVGGQFTQAGGVSVSNVARWDGSSRSDVDGGVGGGSVLAMTVFDEDRAGPGRPALFLGGVFFTAGSAGGQALYMARWDGTSWSNLGFGPNGAVDALETYDDGGGEDLYVGGYFASVAGIPSRMIGRWDGVAWSEVGGGLVGLTGFTSWVADLQVYDSGSGPELYVSGLIRAAGGNNRMNIVRWNGTNWLPVGAGLEPSFGVSMEVYDGGAGPELYVGGAFDRSGATAMNNVGRWNGTRWAPVGLGNGVDATVLALTVHDGALHVGGTFTAAGGQPAASVGEARPATPQVYCTARVNSQGCTPAMAFSGWASVSAASPFDLTASGMLNQTVGILAYSIRGSASRPFQGGTLCMRAPLRRTPPGLTGGSSAGTDCSGSLRFDFNAWIAGGRDARLLPGTQVQAQFWSRDRGFAAPLDAALTDAVEFLICP